MGHFLCPFPARWVCKFRLLWAAYATGDRNLGIYDHEVMSTWQAKNEFESGNRNDSIHDQIRKSGALLGNVEIDLKIAPA